MIMERDSRVERMLQAHGLRKTSSRMDILGLLIHSRGALSQPEIENELKEGCDRVTIYRTLGAFLDKGIVHKVLDDHGAMKYALCAGDCRAATYHFHDHIHFKCTVCGSTTCISDAHIPPFSLPEGYRVSESNVLLQGVCPNCP